jgi:S1-C subfamily serine protease
MIGFWSIISLPLSLAQSNLTDVIKKIEPSIVVIETFDKDNRPIGLGSGFFISANGDVVTNRHVFEKAYSAKIKTFDHKIFNVKKSIG